MASEQERLEKLYGEMGDEHLLDMAGDRDDLTDEARLALDRELSRRGLLPARIPQHEDLQTAPVPLTVEGEREQGFGPGIPGLFPGGAAVMEQALEPAQTSRDGLSSLISFYDGLELSKACEILEDGDMEPVIEAIDGDAQSSVPPRFEIWLDSHDIELAKNLLRARMGLFPLAEVEDDSDGFDAEEFDGEPAEMVVAQFESSVEAEQVRTLLSGQGIEARVESDPESAASASVLVPAADHERALATIAERMGLPQS